MSQARHLIIGTFSFTCPLLECVFFCVSVCGKNGFSVRDDHKDVVDHCCETAQERPSLHIWMQRYGYYITSPTPWLWWAFLVKCSLMWSHIQLNFHECYLVAAILQEWITTNRLVVLCGAGWGFLRHRIRAQVLTQGTRLLHIALSLCGQKNCLGSHHLEPVPSGLYGTCPSVSSHSCYITTDLYHALHFIYSHTSQWPCMNYVINMVAFLLSWPV